MESKKESKETAITKKPESQTVGLTFEFGKVYVKVRGNEILEPIKATFMLFERLGHIYKPGKSWAIAGIGYRLLNTVSSVSLVCAQKVVVDGREQPNPYMERDENTKLPQIVHIRKLGIGMSMIGNIVVIDKTLSYNIKTYFLQSIQKKMKEKREDGTPLHPNCGKLGVKMKKPEEKGEWAFFEIEAPIGVWVNYSDPAILDCMDQHVQRQRFAERIAESIVSRNILKDHPAIGVSTVTPKTSEAGTVAYVTVYGYRNAIEPKNISEILAQTEQGEEGIEVKAETITEVPLEEEESAIDEVEKTEEEMPAGKKDKPKEYAVPGEGDPSKMTKEEAEEQKRLFEKRDER
jgi:hypothetical protein